MQHELFLEDVFLDVSSAALYLRRVAPRLWFRLISTISTGRARGVCTRGRAKGCLLPKDSKMLPCLCIIRKEDDASLSASCCCFKCLLRLTFGPVSFLGLYSSGFSFFAVQSPEKCRLLPCEWIACLSAWANIKPAAGCVLPPAACCIWARRSVTLKTDTETMCHMPHVLCWLSCFLFSYSADLENFKTHKRSSVSVREGQGVVLLCGPPPHSGGKATQTDRDEHATTVFQAGAAFSPTVDSNQTASTCLNFESSPGRLGIMRNNNNILLYYWVKSITLG